MLSSLTVMQTEVITKPTATVTVLELNL